MASRITALLLVAMLPGCGGGGDVAAPVPAPSPAPAPKIALAATNYRSAATLAMGTTSSAFWYAKLGIGVVNDLLNIPLSFLPAPCPTSGSMWLELTDKNADRTLDPGDTVHIHWDHCRAQGTTTTGIVRVEFTSGTQIPDGREYQLTMTVTDLLLQSDQPGIAPVTVNFIAQVHYTHTSLFDHTEIPVAVFNTGQVAGDTGTSTLQVDYLQDYSAQTYRYAVSGNVTSGALGGVFDFASVQPFTGVVGEYPAAGNLSITGSGSSSARLAEEGTAAGDNAAVFAGVDSNGDGVLDASDAQLAWTSIVPLMLFQRFADQAAIAVPIP